MRAGNIFIKHSRQRNAVYPLSSELHNLIQVWHGIPFKRIGFASGDFQGMLERVGRAVAVQGGHRLVEDRFAGYDRVILPADIPSGLEHRAAREMTYSKTRERTPV